MAKQLSHIQYPNGRYITIALLADGECDPACDSIRFDFDGHVVDMTWNELGDIAVLAAQAANKLLLGALVALQEKGWT